ncbi:MAG: GTP 3',8-cyclase MoaA [Lachnospiraceae bacterium]|nr:GTP 3',8-cyclase MoaA [Lachnospiraceae bacterium]
MKDRFGREIDYLRISVTDRCNLRCLYCMPEDIETVPMKEILTFEEIIDVVKCAVKLGISRIKITGGEPLVRRNVCHLIRMIKDIPGISQVTLTTNGLLLEEMIRELAGAGTDSINISLDTLDRDRYRCITGYDKLEAVQKGLESAIDLAIPVKINAVSVNWDRYFKVPGPEGDTGISKDIMDLIGLCEKKPVDVRFIELMPIGAGKDYPGIPHDLMIPMIQDHFAGMEKDSHHGNGPAVYYRIPGYTGRIGFISAVHGKFCDKCNRLRLTSRGYLKSCLCYDTGYDLKHVLRDGSSGSQREERIIDGLEKSILSKPDSHSFSQEEKITEKLTMSAIGG